MTNQTNKPRLAPFSVRFTPEERAKVEAQAGNMPLGSYIKTVLLTQDAPRYRKRRRPPVKDQELLAQVLACLGSTRLASNLNQLAKATHVGNFYFDADAKLAILRAANDVAVMRQLLMLALGYKLPKGEVTPPSSPSQNFARASAKRWQ